MTPLVGRAGERAELVAALDSAVSGRGRLVLLSGPAGIGKSALVDCAVDEAQQRGVAVARGYAIDDPGAPSLWPWRRALRGWPGVEALPLADADDTGGHDASLRFRLFTAVVDLLRDRAEPDGLLLVLEDLHWADAASVLLLRHVAAELREHRLALVVTHRDTPSGPLAAALPDVLRAADARSVVLGGLSGAAIGAWLPGLLAQPAPGLAERLRERTGGNPLLVRLVAEHVAAGGGLDAVLHERPDVRRLVTTKVASLGSDARRLVDAASVLGERLPVPALAAMCGHDDEDLERLLRELRSNGVLRSDDEGLSFEHALVRDAVLAELGEAAAGRLHRRAAEALEGVGAPAGPIAMHWHRATGAGAAGRCREWAERADDEAQAALAHDDAAKFADLAVEAARADGADDAELARLLVRQASALQRANRAEDAGAACFEAADLADRARRPDLLAAAALVVHGVGYRVFTVLPPICERALKTIDPDDHATRARLLAQIATGITEIEGGARGADLAAEALAEADLSGDPLAIVEAIAARHLSITIPQSVAERLELGRRAVALGLTDGAPIAELWGHLWRADAALQLGSLAEAEREIEEIDRVARHRRSALARWHHHRFRAVVLGLTGDLDGARRANMDALELGHRVADISLTGMSYAFAAVLAVMRGDPREALPDWERAIRFAPPLPLVRIVAPLMHAVSGDLDRARAEFAEFRHVPESYPVGIRWAGTLGQIGRCALLLEDADVAAVVYRKFVPIAGYYSGDGSGGVFSYGANASFVADLARVAGQHEDALRHYRDGLAMNTRIGARPWAALTRLGWAQTLAALGLAADPVAGVAGVDLAADAAAEFRRLDMPGPLATTLALVPARETGSPLTPRETEVATLVGEALSNKEIAARLFLSERTVETHVRNILAKLGFSARTEVVAWVLRNQGGRVR